MISKTSLVENKSIPSTRVQGGADFSLEKIRAELENTLTSKYQLNVTVSIDEVDSGRIFDKSTKQCITIVNNEHQNDYNYHVITFAKQGIYCIFEFYMSGYSKNASRIHSGNKEHSTITGSIIGSIRKAMVSNDAYEAEGFYYTMIDDAIKEVLNLN